MSRYHRLVYQWQSTNVNSILLLAIICSYTPQIIRLRYAASSSGLSATYLMLHALFSTAQLSCTLHSVAFIWPSYERPIFKEINQGHLRGMEAFGGILGLLQIFVQWACSIVL